EREVREQDVSEPARPLRDRERGERPFPHPLRRLRAVQRGPPNVIELRRSRHGTPPRETASRAVTLGPRRLFSAERSARTPGAICRRPPCPPGRRPSPGASAPRSSAGPGPPGWRGRLPPAPPAGAAAPPGRPALPPAPPAPTPAALRRRARTGGARASG